MFTRVPLSDRLGICLFYEKRTLCSRPFFIDIQYSGYASCKFHKSQSDHDVLRSLPAPYTHKTQFLIIILCKIIRIQLKRLVPSKGCTYKMLAGTGRWPYWSSFGSCLNVYCRDKVEMYLIKRKLTYILSSSLVSSKLLLIYVTLCFIRCCGHFLSPKCSHSLSFHACFTLFALVVAVVAVYFWCVCWIWYLKQNLLFQAQWTE